MEFNMQLKFVGDLPIVSKHGVGFDHTQADKYSYLQAAVELLEALSYGPTETTQHLYKTENHTLGGDELFHLLKKHIKDIDGLILRRDEKAEEYVNELIQRVNENEALSEDERVAWIGNIKLMKEYFIQYVTNKTAYEEALRALGDEIAIGKVQEVSVPMFKNYGMLLNDLVRVLEQRKQPIDSQVNIEDKDGTLIVRLDITHR